MLSKRSFLGLTAATAATAFSGGQRDGAWAASSPYPARPVRWIVPYTPGGATDLISRLVCQRLSERLGGAFVVENKPGAGSNIGTETVINAPDDAALNDPGCAFA